MKDIKIPGILWVVGIAVAIILIETFVAPGYQLYAEMGIVVLMGVAKAANLGTQQIEDLLALLRRMQESQPGPEGSPRGMAVDPYRTGVDEHEPNKAVRFLLG